ncbi:hypothetical protein BGZ99_002509 [Dissophora globulifera]|uniref:Uncharacterized protein n=1 Tax=Dissophora globulifera TaxID=979702 RepID=A0A9P6RSC0_9FUNG|nr:hypothetical protein BGZ99_002509 [Dissophora globulifera]
MSGFDNPNTISNAPQFDPWSTQKPPQQSQRRGSIISPLNDGDHHSQQEQQDRKLQLLEHPNVVTELQTVLQKWIRLQQPASSPFSRQVDIAAPCLFVILPKVVAPRGSNQTQAEQLTQDDFCLHFLCHYGDDHGHQHQHQFQLQNLRRQSFLQDDVDTMDLEDSLASLTSPASPIPFSNVGVTTAIMSGTAPSAGASTTTTIGTTTSPSPRLHVCEPEDGYHLRDFNGFCQVHKMCLLSPLQALRKSLFLSEMEELHNLQQRMQRGDSVEGSGAQDCSVVNINNSLRPSLPSTPPEPTPSSADASVSTSVAAEASPMAKIQERVDMAIRYLLRYFDVSELERIAQRPTDRDMDDFETPAFLQTGDFADSDKARILKTTTSDGQILGPLVQRSSQPASKTQTGDNDHDDDDILASLSLLADSRNTSRWLCPDHVQAHDLTEACERLEAVITKNDGHCVKQERSVEIYFKSRERAQEFYSVLSQFQLLLRLKIRLGWQDLNEDDLWELAQTVTVASIPELTLDCRAEIEPRKEAKDDSDNNTTLAESDQHLTEEQKAQQQQKTWSFKPVIGMMFSPSLISLTLENYSGSPFTLEASNFTVAPESFSLETYRNSSELHLPICSNLGSLILNNCGPHAKSHHWLELIQRCPSLSEIQLECDKADEALVEIGEATHQLDRITYVKLSESLWETAEMWFGKLNRRTGLISKHTTLQKMNRKTRRPLTISVQCCGEIETMSISAFLNLWETQQPQLLTLIVQNPRLSSLEIMCETQTMARMWRFLSSHYRHQQIVRQQLALMQSHDVITALSETVASTNNNINTALPTTPESAPPSSYFRLRLHDDSCTLMAVSPTQNALLLHAYTEKHRLLIQSLEDITMSIVIGTGFHSAEQLALLRSHIEQDGGFRFNSFCWLLAPAMLDDPYFMGEFQALIAAWPELTRREIRVFAPLFDSRDLIRAWNWVIGTPWLNEEEHGRWMQSCFEHEHDDEEGGIDSVASKLKVTREASPDRVANVSAGASSSATPMTSTAAGLASAASAFLSDRSVKKTSRQGMGQIYTLPLDEEKELTLASQQYFFSTLGTSSVAGSNTAMTYSLTLTTRQNARYY